MNSRYLNVFRTGLLVGDIPPNSLLRDCADAAHLVTAAPHAGQPRLEPRKFASQFVRREAFELRRNMRGSEARVGLDKQVNVVRHNFQRVNRGVQFLRFAIKQLPQSLLDGTNEYFESVLRTPDEVILERVQGSDADSVAIVNHTSSVARKLEICKKSHRRRTAFLCPLKRAVPCGF